MTTSQEPEEPRRDGSGDESGNFDDEFLDAAANARRRLLFAGKLLVAAVAITLIPCLAVLFYLLSAMISVLEKLSQANSNLSSGEEVFAIVAGLSFLAILLLAAILRGTIAMLQFRNYGQARAAVILGVVSVVLLQPASVFVLPCSIWVWIVLNDPLVKQEFKRVAREASDAAKPKS